MTPEEAAAEEFARILEERFGGRWLPVERDERKVPPSTAREVGRTFSSPADEDTILDR